jgi:hypothetical protein
LAKDEKRDVSLVEIQTPVLQDKTIASSAKCRRDSDIFLSNLVAW